MLFTSPAFVFFFAPLTFALFFLVGRYSRAGAAAWLFVASLWFYAHWSGFDTWLLLGSIAANFFIAQRILHATQHRKAWLVFGLVFDLGVLGWFKYANFAANNLRNIWPELPAPGVVLPLGISFYTFTQIAFLVDTYQRKASESKGVHYGLFVTYFPHLVAGPVLHHAQMMPQFKDPAIYRPNAAHMVGGLVIFSLGLFKKVVLADGMSPYADAVFKGADTGATPALAEAWLAALAYTLQLYFDFSGYSDMAVGLSWILNVKLPFNFNSPYKATNISEFWRRWHISLSTFLRDYLYIAMGGNRFGAVRRYFNLFITMVLGGLWHGASWSFVLWGAMHGAYLMVHHAFRAACGERLYPRLQASRVWRVVAWGLTLLSVVAAWVVFRAETFNGSLTMLRSMADLTHRGDTLPLLWNAGLKWHVGMIWVLLLGAMALFAPNSNVLGERVLVLARARPVARALMAGAALTAVVLLVMLNATRDAVSAFIYFNF